MAIQKSPKKVPVTYTVLMAGHTQAIACYTVEQMRTQGCMSAEQVQKMLLASPSPMLEESGIDFIGRCNNPECRL